MPLESWQERVAQARFVMDINIAENRSVRDWGLLGAERHQSLTSASLLREFPFFYLANQQTMHPKI